MKSKNIFSGLKSYNFEDPNIIKDFLDADIELSTIMIKKAKNLTDLSFKFENNTVSLLKIVDDLDKLKMILNSDKRKSGFYQAYSRSDNYKNVLSLTDNIEKAKMIIDFYKDTGALNHIVTGKNLLEEVNNPSIIQLLIDSGMSPDKGYMGKSIIENVKSITKLEVLVKNNANINLLTKEGVQLYAHFAKNTPYLSSFIFEQKSFNPNLLDKDGKPLIVNLIKKNDKEKLIKHPVFDVNIKSANPLLHYFKNEPEIIDLLLSTNKININLQRFNNNPPFVYIDNTDSLFKIYKLDEQSMSIFEEIDSNNNKLLFSKDITLFKFNFLLDNISSDNNIFYDKGEHLLIFLAKNNNEEKLLSFLKKSKEKEIDLSSIQDNNGNNLMAYISDVTLFKKVIEEYNIDISHKNKEGNYSILESLSKTYSLNYLIDIKNKLDSNNIDQVISDIELIDQENKKNILSKEKIVEKLEKENHSKEKPSQNVSI